MATFECKRCHKGTANRNLCDDCSVWYDTLQTEMREKALKVMTLQELKPLLDAAWNTLYATSETVGNSDYDAKLQAVVWKDALETRERTLLREEHEVNKVRRQTELAQDSYHERMKPYTDAERRQHLLDEDEED